MSFMADTIFIRSRGADGSYHIEGLTVLAVVVLVVLLLILAPSILKGLGYVNDQQKFIAYNFDPSAQRMKQIGSSYAGLVGASGTAESDAANQKFLGVPEAPVFSGVVGADQALLDTAPVKNTTGLGPVGELAAADAAAAKAAVQGFKSGSKQHLSDAKLMQASGTWKI
jgi:hypothetical protein